MEITRLAKVLSVQDIKKLRTFFKTYKVLFAGAWEEEIVESDITAYFQQRVDLSELVQDMPKYEQYSQYLDSVNTIEDLERVVREHSIFNMHD